MSQNMFNISKNLARGGSNLVLNSNLGDQLKNKNNRRGARHVVNNSKTPGGKTGSTEININNRCLIKYLV